MLIMYFYKYHFLFPLIHADTLFVYIRTQISLQSYKKVASFWLEKDFFLFFLHT